jgi:hypothetical protein
MFSLSTEPINEEPLLKLPHGEAIYPLLDTPAAKLSSNDGVWCVDTPEGCIRVMVVLATFSDAVNTGDRWSGIWSNAASTAPSHICVVARRLVV